MTPGKGLEWTPFVTGDGKHIAFIGATAQRPPLPMVMPISGGTPRLLGEDRIPSDFPSSQLVVPKKVVFKSPDGLDVHAQLFEPAAARVSVITSRAPDCEDCRGVPPWAHPRWPRELGKQRWRPRRDAPTVVVTQSR